MANMASYDSLVFTSPINGAAATAYFAKSLIPVEPGNNRLAKWTYPAIDSQSMKQMGKKPIRLEQSGWVEGSSKANLSTAMQAVEAKVGASQSSNTLTAWATRSYSAMVMLDLKWGSMWSYNGRFCADYTLAYEGAE